jgi:hypothetical protein
VERTGSGERMPVCARWPGRASVEPYRDRQGAVIHGVVARYAAGLLTAPCRSRYGAEGRWLLTAPCRSRYGAEGRWLLTTPCRSRYGAEGRWL